MKYLKHIILLLSLMLALPAFAKDSDAFQALQKMTADFSNGKVSDAEKVIDIAMIGRQEIVEAMNSSLAKQKQIRISFSDTTTNNVGKEVVVIKTSWEKRSLSVPAMTAVEQKGQSLFFMQKIKKNWKLVGQSGDNLFAP